MDESQKKHKVIVGVFVFIGLLFLLGGILLVGNLRDTFNQKMQLVSRFDDVNGLQQGNNIWYSGVKIGTVGDMRFFGKSQVEVVLNIKTSSRKYIRKDAKVKIGSDGLIGNKILVIYGGTDQFPMVDEGDTLSVEKTFSSEDVLNTLQHNNENILDITNNLKTITDQLSSGRGTVGKLLQDSSAYMNLNAMLISLHSASDSAQRLIGSLSQFSQGLNKKGTLINELTSDTVTFRSIKASVGKLQEITDTAAVFLSGLKETANNPNTMLGVMIHDETAGSRMKEMIKNLESSSVKLDEDLEAVQHNFLLRGYFRKKAKDQEKQTQEK